LAKVTVLVKINKIVSVLIKFCCPLLLRRELKEIMDRINHSTWLAGETVKLVPMNQWHFDELDELAKDERIWEFIPSDMSANERRLNIFSNALVEREKGTQFPFVIIHKKDRRIIGSTRLMDIQALHRKLEIGWTWLHPGYWATKVNPECKFLLLQFCFEQLQAARVQFKTDENNMRSRKAIEKIGGMYEGTLRNDMVKDNGTKRNSAYFSIIDSEWDLVKKELALLAERKEISIKI
jgi:RimJ/RimL family protein N-acetyltransferase